MPVAQVYTELERLGSFPACDLSSSAGSAEGDRSPGCTTEAQ